MIKRPDLVEKQDSGVISYVGITALTATMVLFAIADRLIGFPIGSDVFWDIDPCTGQWHEVTLSGYVYLHVGHPNNFVVKLKRFGITDSG